MLAARIDAQIQRRLAAGRALQQRFGQIELQRVVVQRMVLRLGQLGGEVQVVAQRVVRRQLAQAFGAAAVEAFQIGEK
ncbi:hypothetical protein D3C79_499320 [compost metagenome]